MRLKDSYHVSSGNMKSCEQLCEKAIVAIGGGEILTRGTGPIDQKILHLSNKKQPRLLFIPTARSDSERYGKIPHSTGVRFTGDHPFRSQTAVHPRSNEDP